MVLRQRRPGDGRRRRRFFSFLHDHRAGAGRTVDGNSNSRPTSECRLVVPRSQPASWRFCPGGCRVGPRSGRKRQHPSCPANAHRNNADSGAKAEESLARAKAVGSAFPRRRATRHRELGTGFGYSRQRGIPPRRLRRAGAARARSSGTTGSRADERNSRNEHPSGTLNDQRPRICRRSRTAQASDRFLARRSRTHGHPRRLRARRLRRLHDLVEWRAGALLFAVRRAGERRRLKNH